MLGEPLREAVKEAARLDDPAQLELFASDLLPAVALRSMPGTAAAAVDAIAELPGARTLLRAMAAAAAPPLSVLAGEAAGRLGSGPVSLAAEQVGTLVPDRAWELDLGEPVSCVLVSCARPGSALRQVLCFTLERLATGGAIKDGFASEPVELGELDEAFLRPMRADGVEPGEIPPERAVELVADGAARCAEAGLGPTREALFAATLLLRAGGRGDADELLEPLLGLPSLAETIDDLLADDADEDAREAQVDELVDDLGAWCEQEVAGDDEGDLVLYAGGCMADFRARYGDGRVAGWSAADLEEFLLDFVPRKVGLGEDDVERFPGAVAQVLRFLGESGRLDADRADRLMLLAHELHGKFAERARDPANFGLAKGMVAAMAGDGVDPTDEAAVEEWIETFNARSREEREALVPAIASPPLPLAPPQPARASRKAAKAKKARRAQGQARKRNRRR